MIIAFVGVDGTGKSTLLTETAEYLSSLNYKVQVLKALKGDTLFLKNFNKIKAGYLEKYPNNMHYVHENGAVLMAFDLFRISEELKNNESEYDFILLDRWAICQKIYSKTWLVNSPFVDNILDMCLTPELTFVIDADLSQIEQRISQREVIHDSEHTLALNRAQKRYRKFASISDDRVLIENNDGEKEASLEKIKNLIGGLIDNENSKGIIV